MENKMLSVHDNYEALLFIGKTYHHILRTSMLCHVVYSVASIFIIIATTKYYNFIKPILCVTAFLLLKKDMIKADYACIVYKLKCPNFRWINNSNYILVIYIPINMSKILSYPTTFFCHVTGHLFIQWYGRCAYYRGSIGTGHCFR